MSVNLRCPIEGPMCSSLSGYSNILLCIYIYSIAYYIFLYILYFINIIYKYLNNFSNEILNTLKLFNQKLFIKLYIVHPNIYIY